VHSGFYVWKKPTQKTGEKTSRLVYSLMESALRLAAGGKILFSYENR